MEEKSPKDSILHKLIKSQKKYLKKYKKSYQISKYEFQALQNSKKTYSSHRKRI